MDSASQTAVGLAGDDSDSSAESSAESSKSGDDSAEIPTRLDTFMGLTAAACDATLATEGDTEVDGGLALGSQSENEDLELALSDESDDEPLRLEEDVAVHVDDAQDSHSDSAPLFCDEEEAATQVSRDWEPGVNMGRWGTTQSEGLGPDAQAMLVNICLKVKRMPSNLRKKVASFFGVQGQGGFILAASRRANLSFLNNHPLMVHTFAGKVLGLDSFQRQVSDTPSRNSNGRGW